MVIHTVLDFAAWISAWLVARFVANCGYLKGVARDPTRDPGYFISLGLGAIAGAFLFGSINMMLAHMWQLGHSIIGAIAGGTVAVELYKLSAGIKTSTGGQFVAPLAVGIAIGRLGCFFAGLPDYTYGTATLLPWGVDFGDGIMRHPVQLYESLAMLAFLAVYLRGLARGAPLLVQQGFYVFVGWYAFQRFLWEFLKPYPTVFGPFNAFHLVCIALLVYSFVMRGRNDELRTAI